MAIPSNYIDKITKEGDSRMICPAADKVRVENQNFESDDLDGALNELAGGKANKDETYTKEEVNEKVPLRIAAIKNGDVITSTTDYGEIANAVKEDWRDAYVVVNNEAIFSFYQVEQNAIIFTRVDAEDGTQAYLAVSSNNVWSIEYSAISGGGEGTVTGVKVGEVTYPPNTEGVVDISMPISNKVDKVTGKGLSTNDYTDAEKTKLAGIAAGAQVNVISGIKAHGASTNLPVTNGVVELPESEAPDLSGYATTAAMNTALAGKQDTLTFDFTPTASSTNPVTSGGVKTYVDGKASITGITTSQDGTFTIAQSDGNSYTVNLNHVHPQYLKYELLADEAAYTALSTKDSSTLYLIPETT